MIKKAAPIFDSRKSSWQIIAEGSMMDSAPAYAKRTPRGGNGGKPFRSNGQSFPRPQIVRVLHFQTEGVAQSPQ